MPEARAQAVPLPVARVPAAFLLAARAAPVPEVLLAEGYVLEAVLPAGLLPSPRAGT